MDSNCIKWALPVSVTSIIGSSLTLVPLDRCHEPELTRIASHPEIWHYLTSDGASPIEMHNYLSKALDEFESGAAIPFVIRVNTTGALIGMTRLKELSPQHRKVVIGSWLTPSAWGTGANTESKALLLQFAFEVLGCYRVEFITDAHNIRSRSALAKLGVVEEGTLRSHLVVRGGVRRDSVVFSIIDADWPMMKDRLRRYFIQSR